MNKNLQTALGMIFLVSSAIGQTTDFNVKAGNEEKAKPQTFFTPIIKVGSSNLNYGSNNSSVADYKKQLSGIQAGVSVQVGLASNFSLLSEFYYMRKGGTLKANNPLTGNETAYRFNTLELPALARIHMGRVHLNAGPSIAYNLSGKEKTDDQSKSISFNTTGDGFRRFEAGVQMGGGFTFPSKKKQFVLDIRYNHGLTNLSNSKEMYNRSIVVSLIGIKPSKTKTANKIQAL
jgi:hypothetical protein